MYWYNYLYADKKVHHISRLKYKIEKGCRIKGVYLSFIYRNAGARCWKDRGVLLQQSHHPKESLCIVGNRSSRELH